MFKLDTDFINKYRIGTTRIAKAYFNGELILITYIVFNLSYETFDTSIEKFTQD
jgi:hypothetical protein